MESQRMLEQEGNFRKTLEAQSEHVVKLASELDKELTITYLLGHLRELRLLIGLDIEGRDRYIKRDEALLHAIPIILKFGCRRIELPSVEEILSLLDGIERLVDISDMMNILEIAPGSRLEIGIEAQFEGTEHHYFEDLRNYRLRLIQFHSLLNKPLSFPSEWIEEITPKIKYFDPILKNCIDLSLDDFMRFLRVAAKEQARMLNVGGELFRSNTSPALDGFDFTWGFDTFSWTDQKIKEVFAPNGTRFTERLLRNFEFIPSHHEAPFVLYKQVQFNPFIRIGERWFFSVEYLLACYVPMIIHKVESWVDKGFVTKKEFQDADGRILDDQIVALLKDYGYKPLFKNVKFFPSKGDDITESTEIDLFFESPCGDYLAIEAKGGRLSDEMLYGLSFRGFRKELGRNHKKVRQVEKQYRVLNSNFGRRRLKECVPNFDEHKKLLLISVSRYPLFASRMTKTLFCTVDELRIILKNQIDLFSGGIVYEQLFAIEGPKVDIPVELHGEFPEGFVISSDMSEIEQVRKSFGWAIWLNRQQVLYDTEVEGRKGIVLFKNRRKAVSFAKRELKEKIFRVMNLYEGHPFVVAAERSNYAAILVESFKAGEIRCLLVEWSDIWAFLKKLVEEKE